MKSLNGEYKITLDDKGRLSLPAKIRAALDGNTHMLTRGPDNCIQFYPLEGWNKLMEQVRASSTAFQSDFRALRRRLIGSEVEIDKAGRIAIPQSLREYGELTRDCIVLGLDDFVEIWDADRYRTYDDESKEDVEAAYEKLGAALLREKDAP